MEQYLIEFILKISDKINDGTDVINLDEYSDIGLLCMY